MMSTDPKHDLATLLGKHHQDFSSGPFAIGCGCGESMPSDAAHRAHIAEVLAAAGWVSPEEHAAALDDLHETVDQVNRVSALAADLQRRGDTDGARLIFAALNGERA